MTLTKTIYFVFLSAILLSSFGSVYLLNEAYAQLLPLPPLPDPLPLPLPINRSPTATNDSATTSENTPVTINVLKNDSDPDGDALSVTSTSAPSNGAATINSDNTITYSPNQGFSGTDSFTYRISDGNGGHDAATVNVTVFAAPSNTPPTASNDSVTTDENTPITINVLANDSDPDGDTLSVVSASNPSNGAAVINSDNTITYSPNSGFSGTDTFSYTVSDGNGGSDAAAVTVTVFAAPPPPPPTATLTVESADMTGETFEGMWIELLQNGQLVDSGLTPFSTTVDAEVQYTVVANNFENIVFDHWDDGSTDPARAFSISQDVAFTAFYQTGTAPQNNPPVAADDSATTDEDTSITINVLANDSDPDGDALSVTSTSAPSNGAAVINSDNTITYSPNSGFSGTDSFTYTISDGNGGSDTATIIVTVSDTSQPNNPPVAADDSATTNQDVPVTIPVLANDSDPDSDTLSVISTSTPSNGAAVINSDNTITYSPNSGFSGTDTFSYTVSDGNGGSDAATVTITVFDSAPGNNPPTAANDVASTDEDVPVTIPVLANDSDPDGDTVFLTSFDSTSFGKGTITRDDNGTPQDQSDDKLVYTGPDNGFGTDEFTYTISDGNGGIATAKVTVNVAFVNDPPIANDDTATTNINTPVTIDVLANDVDYEIEHSTVIISVSSPASGTATNNSGSSITYTPNQDFVGTDTFQYTVTDPEGATDTATVTVTVSDPFANVPPVANNDTATTPINTPVTIPVLANDSDPNGDTISLTSFDADSQFNGTITRDTNGTPQQSDDSLVYTPPANQFGTDRFTYTISDGRGGTDTATVTVTVSPS